MSAAAGTALVAATFALPGAGVAYASGNGSVTGNGNVSLLSGNTVNVPISAPLNLCGVSIGLLGFANSDCEGGASSSLSGVGGDSQNGNVTGNGNVSTGSGNTVNAPISAPVNICGVSGAIGGSANSHCRGGATSSLSGVGGDSHNGNVTGNGNVSTGSGNTVNAPVSAPVNLCGISLALLGFSNAGCVGGTTSSLSGVGGDSQNGNVTGNGNVSTGSGNTVNAPVSAPVNVCGVAVAGLGFSNAECKGGSSSCIGETCTPPTCQGERCTPPPCEENMCHTPPPCEENTCHTPPPCEENTCHTPLPCQGNCNTPPPCQGDCNTPPPPCQSNCTPPTTPPSSVGATTVTTAPSSLGTTTVTAATMPSGSLPTTGADLLLLGVAALGTFGAGAGTVALARRRRNGETS